jgi:hypothetical protein
METLSKESLIILAIQALENDPKLSVQKAAQIYKVSYITLSHRRKGILSRVEIIVKSQKLSNLEEKTIV